MGKRALAVAFLTVLMGAVFACAQGNRVDDGGGAGGASSAGVGGAATGIGGAAIGSGTTIASTGTSFPETSSVAVGTGGGGAGGGAVSSSPASSVVASSSSGPACGGTQHDCGGTCEPNTPDTGCLQSSTCTPCAAVTNGTTTCTAGGQCSFTCDTGFAKSGGACVCAPSPSHCCQASDCSNGTTCQTGACACDSTKCIAYCFGSCGSPIGACVQSACICGC